ncbi:MAG: hypothetical protein OES09_04210 [Gammaproteobacteria bacterium]|nr:hypothetical protein [Gammaproteobacteria bacterium]
MKGTGYRPGAWMLWLACAASPALGADLSGYVAAEFRAFTSTALDPRQHDENLSVVAEPEWSWQWNDGRSTIAFVPFARLDQNDDERTHVDIRELAWSTAHDAWELRLGVRKVFWGVTESQHLVDIINQTDVVENPDGEDKLGQPMINLALINDWGTVDLFVLLGFRERTFPGAEGRLRTHPRVDVDRAIFESSREERHVDFAVRWSHAIGDWDLGLAQFHGTTRDPRFVPVTDPDGERVLAPVYEQINQSSADIQATKGSWLWKLEALTRSGQGERISAAVGGFEYTFYGMFDTPLDLGVVAEYLYTDRPVATRSPFEDDVFAGVRLTLNDAQSSTALLGCIVDLGESGRLCSLEASRRLSDHWVLSIEARQFQDLDPGDPLFTLRRDDYLQAELAYHF